MNKEVLVVGAGLAGSEAAWQIASQGLKVRLVEMRPLKQTPAHRTGLFAELVCSNSLRSDALENAVGLLKEEMRRLDSLIMQVADQERVPAGGALAVDREAFARTVTAKLSSHPQITIERKEVSTVPLTGGVCVLATGPLTSPQLAESIAELTGTDQLYFYDAVADVYKRQGI